MNYRRLYSAKVNKSKGIKCDQTIMLNNYYSAKDLLSYSEERYHNLFNNIHVEIYRTMKGHFTEVNEAMIEIFGFAYEEFIGKPAWHLAKPDLRDRIKNLMFEKATNHNHSAVEVECIKRDGSVLFAEIRISYSDMDNSVYGIVNDISDRKKLTIRSKLRLKKKKFCYVKFITA
jgi:PAS domain S-box-containing protein